MRILSVVNAGADTDRFLVQDATGAVKFRTGAEVASDIGAENLAASALEHIVKAAVALTKGQAVYVSGADGTNMLVSKASNASEGTSTKTMGLIDRNLAINDMGYVVTEGLLDGLDTSTATIGDPVWLGVDGNLIYGLANKPLSPAHLVFIGIVTRVQSNNGEIFVKVQNGFELDELHDVLITGTPVDKAVIQYDSASGLWKNSALAGVTASTGTAGQVAYFTGATTQGGSNNLFWDATNNRLGIGTNTPAYALDISGTANYLQRIRNSSGTGAAALIFNNTSSDFYIGIDNSTGSTISGTPYARVILGVGAYPLIFGTSSLERARIFSTGNFGINTGSTDSGQRLQVNGTGYFSDSVGIGTTALSVYSLRISKNITGSFPFAVWQDGTVQSTASNIINGFQNSLRTQAASFTISEYNHFSVEQYTLGAGSSVTTQTGFNVDNTVTGATNNYAFRGQIAAATGRWNLYMNGTANNYMAGSLGIGTTSLTGRNLVISKQISGASTAYGILNDGQIQSSVTSNAVYFQSASSTQAASFTISGGIYHFFAGQGTFGAGSTVNNQYGFYVDASGATNNYGFYGNIAAGTNRWNLYMNGTANNYMAGSLGIGSTSLTGTNLGINKVITGSIFSSAVSAVGSVQSDVTNSGFGFYAATGTQATSFTLPTLVQYQSDQGSFGAGSTITNHIGFRAANISSASVTNAFAFQGTMAAATNRWNLYMSGTANNYMAGSLGIGTTLLTGVNMFLFKNITGSVNSVNFYSRGEVKSDVTNTARYYSSFATTEATTFTLNFLQHYYASQGTIGAGSTVVNQYGFTVESNMVGATNNFGFFGNIPSGTGRWNLYMSGTAANYLNGELLIGSTTNTGEKLQVTGTAKITGATSIGGTLNVTGNVGIGTAADVLYPLKVERSTAGVGIQVYNSTTYSQIRLQSSGTNQSSYLTFNPTGTGNAVIQVNDADKVTITSAGNLGLAVTPSAWGGSFKALDINTNGASLISTGTADARLYANAYFNGTSWLYKGSSLASGYQQSSGIHYWYNAISGTAGGTISWNTAMTLNNSGNLGLGVTPSAWNAYYKSIQYPAGAISSIGTGEAAYLHNSFISSAGLYTYVNTAAAARYSQAAGAHYWFYAPSGTAGTTITFTRAMTLTDAGRLIINSVSDTGEQLQVTGTAKITGATTFGAAITTTTDVNSGRDVNVANGRFLTFSPAASSSLGKIRFGDTAGTGGTLRFVRYSDELELMTLTANGNFTVDTNTLFVDATNNRVGIGTTTPGYKLHLITDAVAGRQDMTNISRTSGNLVRFTNPQYSTDASMGIIFRVFPDSDLRQGAGIIASGGANNACTDLDLFVTSSPDGLGGTSYSALKIKGNTGAVGINNLTPLYSLDVTGQARISDAIAIGAGAVPTAGYNLDVSGTARITGNLTVDTNTLFVDATNDRVGIGTVTPVAALDMYTTSTAFHGLHISNSTYGATLGDGMLVGVNNSSSYVWTYENIDLEIGTNSATRIYVKPSGNIGIGTPSPLARLHVSGTGRVTSDLLVGGIVTLSNLAGTGNRIVVADSTGILSTQATDTFITSLTGEATSSGGGATTVTLTNSAVIGKVLTGLNVNAAAITSSDSILSAFGKLQGQIDGLQGGTVYEGSWNASTNTPTIVSSTGTQGQYYVVTTAGTTTIDGVSSWAVGDWIIFNGTVWEKIPNVDAITSVNGQTGVVSLTTTDISEGTNLYYTDARARAAISLTTTGASGAATYSSGVLNIPTYTLTGLGGTPSSRTLTINGTALDLSADRSWSVGTVTSVNATVPTGFAVGSAVTSSGDIAISFAAGYSLPTTASQANWNAAYNDKINSAAVTGTTTKTLTLTQQDGGTITASWTDINTDAVSSVFGRTGAVIATSGDYTTAQVTESGNLYYTDARARAAISLTTTGTSGAATYSGGVLNIPQYQTALTNPITGTGGSGLVAFFNGGTTLTGESAFYWDSTNERLGIGLSNNTPLYKLHVLGTGYFSDNVRFPLDKGILLDNTSNNPLGKVYMYSFDNSLRIENDTNSINVLTNSTYTSGNFGVGHGGSVFGSGTTTISVLSGTAPTSSVSSAFLMYSQAVSTNNAAPHFRTENGAVIKLYQETTAVGNAIFLQGGGNNVLDDTTFDGYTLRQIVRALRNLGILQ